MANVELDPIDALLKAFPPPAGKKNKKPKDDAAQGGQSSDDHESNWQDSDQDGAPDDQDTDDDNDGVPDDQDADDDGDGMNDQDDGSSDDSSDDQFGGDDDADGTDDEGDEGQEGEDDGGAVEELEQEAQQASGDLQGLIQQVADLERDYYAAKGMHGAGHHKSEAQLDMLMRVVRKMVRAIVQDPSAGSSAGASNADSDGDGTPNYVDTPDAQSSSVGTEAADPNGDGDVTNDDEGDDADMDDAAGDEQSEDSQGGSVDGEDQQTPRASGAGQAKNVPPQLKGKGKKKPPFGKSLDAIDALEPLVKAARSPKALRKSLAAFDSASASVPDAHLYEYMVQFLSAAHAVCALDQPHAADNLAIMAPAVMSRLVNYIPKNPSLRAAATKYSVNLQGVEKIMKERGIVDAIKNAVEQSENDDGGDASGNAAMGAKNLDGEVSLKSAPAWYEPDARAKDIAGAPGVQRTQLVKSVADQIVDDTVNPFAALAKSRQRQHAAAFRVPDVAVRATIDNACMIHGKADLTKSQNLWNPHARCTCPR